MYNGRKGSDCGSGSKFWDDLKMHTITKYKITVKLQMHKMSDDVVVGISRSIGFWSNHNHKFRVIYKAPINNNWKELDHSDDWDEICNKFDQYKQVLEWKQCLIK